MFDTKDFDYSDNARLSHARALRKMEYEQKIARNKVTIGQITRKLQKEGNQKAISMLIHIFSCNNKITRKNLWKEFKNQAKKYNLKVSFSQIKKMKTIWNVNGGIK